MNILKRVSLPAVILTFISIVILSIPDIKDSFEPPLLLPVLDTLFLGLLPFAAAFFCARTYLETNLTNPLLMCCGMTVLGLGAIASGWLRYIPNGANVNMTVYITCALAGALFHLSAAMHREPKKRLVPQGNKIRMLALSLSGVNIFTAALALAAIMDRLPPFIVNGGFTALRQTVLWFSIAGYLSASMLFAKIGQGKKPDYFYWYSISLAFLAAGLLAGVLQPSVGSPIAWIGRIDQYAGGFFALVYISAVKKSAKAGGSTFSSAISDFFDNTNAIYTRVAETTNIAIVSVDRDLRIVYLNPAAEKLFGAGYSEAMGAHFLERYVSQRSAAALRDRFTASVSEGTSALPDKAFEIEAKDGRGRAFPAEVTAAVSVLPSGCVSTYVISDISERKEAEKALRGSEERYRGVVQNTSAVILRMDPKGVIRFANQRALEFFGYEEKELIGKPAVGTIIPERETTGRDLVKMEDEIMAGPDLFHTNANENMRKNGERVWMEWTNSGVYDGEGRLKEFLSVGIDATERKRAEEKAKANELLMQTIMDSASDFMFIKDTESRIVMVNKAYGKTFGVDIKDVIGKNDYELYPDPEMVRGVIENDRHVMRTGETLVCEESAMTKDGYKTFLLSKVPWRDAKGRITGVLGVAHDITELKNARDSLQKTVAFMKYQKEYIGILYETSGKILSSTEPRKDVERLCGKVMSFLGCHAFFNYLLEDGEEAMRLNACEGVTERQRRDMELLPLDSEACGCAARDGCVIIAENIQAAQDPETGLVRSLGMRAYACYPLTANGRVIGTLSFGTRSKDSFNEDELMLMKTVAESVSVAFNRKRNEDTLIRQAEELKSADRNKNEFLSALSHELRNPLAAIVAGLSLLDISSTHEQQEKAKEVMKRQIQQLSSLVDDLLEITRISRNMIVLKKEKVELDKIAASVADDHKALFDEKSIRFERDIEAGPIYIEADSVRLKQIIGNILHNALKFTDHGGGVTLSVCSDKGQAVVRVKDSGSGIDSKFLPDLFEPFKQADKSLDRRFGGLGLGLSIVKEITELHGGSVKAYSEGPGKGSEFSIYLPTAG